MKTIACYIKSSSLREDVRVADLFSRLRQVGFQPLCVQSASEMPLDCEILLSIGGDGTFLSASGLFSESGVPILGVNMGRLGFLSQYTSEAVVDALESGEYSLVRRHLLAVSGDCFPELPAPALNEVSVSRIGTAMLGVNVSLDSQPLPTFWADGLLVATSSGSTAYSMSVGGPICMPDARVLIIAPIASHNLNVRPLVVPDSAKVELSFFSREEQVRFSVDNRNYVIPADSKIHVCTSDCCLNTVSLGQSSFIDALRTRLFWGQDVRNNNER